MLLSLAGLVPPHLGNVPMLFTDGSLLPTAAGRLRDYFAELAEDSGVCVALAVVRAPGRIGRDLVLVTQEATGPAGEIAEVRRPSRLSAVLREMADMAERCEEVAFEEAV